MTDTLSRLRALCEAASPLPVVLNCAEDCGWHDQGRSRATCGHPTLAGRIDPIVLVVPRDSDDDWDLPPPPECPLRRARDTALLALLAVAEAARAHAEECEREGNGGMNTVPTELIAALRALDEVKP